jgi:UrcA family protein
MNGQIRIVTAAVATLVTCFVFEPSWAARMPAAPSIAVSLAGLNLDKEDDARVLYRRLQKAALEVCQQVVGPTMTVQVGKCASGLLDRAVSEVNRPALTAVHGRPTPPLSARR